MDDWDEIFRGIPGRTFSVTCFGDNVDEIEMAALTEAEHVFGPGVALAVIPTYHIHWTSMQDQEVTGKRYVGHMYVLARPRVPS